MKASIEGSKHRRKFLDSRVQRLQTQLMINSLCLYCYFICTMAICSHIISVSKSYLLHLAYVKSFVFFVQNNSQCHPKGLIDSFGEEGMQLPYTVVNGAQMHVTKNKQFQHKEPPPRR